MYFLSKALYPVGTVPQEWPGLGDPPMSKSNSEPWELRSIEQAMVDLGHFSRDVNGVKGGSMTVISVLKIDTEGSEWDSLGAFFGSEAVAKAVAMGFIRQLLVEWHWDPDSTARNQRHNELLTR